ncbi:hypothetical protein [Parafrankia sp. EUN1f]|uniref:hypothetical protein n=1 Tax=Parafrankia sp. EUN1f TaxID=102897 RepID=UPI0012F7DAB4|nr:hypothetical protein [Parafrankia sp. EUN1f]
MPMDFGKCKLSDERNPLRRFPASVGVPPRGAGIRSASIHTNREKRGAESLANPQEVRISVAAAAKIRTSCLREEAVAEEAVAVAEDLGGRVCREMW